MPTKSIHKPKLRIPPHVKDVAVVLMVPALEVFYFNLSTSGSPGQKLNIIPLWNNVRFLPGTTTFCYEVANGLEVRHGRDFL